ncbi:MAG: transposase, partial [Nostoc sp. DedSLP03]|uniref:transposase n=1 Tax=Nostoc sp. DedSLP03 TaxID=3075400 RepID=UPI002AD2A147
MINEIIAIYCITDDILNAIGHQEDKRRKMNDASILTTAMTAALFFGGNHQTAREYMVDHGLMPKMLSKSRFNRRLHAIDDLMEDLFHQLGAAFKLLSRTSEYLIDSFPVAVCHNIRISRCRLVNSPEYRGYVASKRCYFYGVRVHLLSTADGIPVELAFLPGAAHDLRNTARLRENRWWNKEYFV